MTILSLFLINRVLSVFPNVTLVQIMKTVERVFEKSIRKLYYVMPISESLAMNLEASAVRTGFL